MDQRTPLPTPNPQSLSEQAKKIAVSQRYHFLFGALAIALGAGLSIAAGFLLFTNYVPTREDEAIVVTPKPSAQNPASCHYQQVQCIRAPCPPVWVCGPDGSGAASNWIMYRDDTYGIEIALPDSWKGYTVTVDTWNAVATKGGTRTVQGPTLHIVHPLSTKENPRQDIPVMIFSIEQWNKSLSQDWSFGAAPIGPSELTRNDTYVFALPARYNYAFRPGFEEVEVIMALKAIRAF